jgi:hypothetical protein
MKVKLSDRTLSWLEGNQAHDDFDNAGLPAKWAGKFVADGITTDDPATLAKQLQVWLTMMSGADIDKADIEDYAAVRNEVRVRIYGLRVRTPRKNPSGSCPKCGNAWHECECIKENPVKQRTRSDWRGSPPRNIDERTASGKMIFITGSGRDGVSGDVDAFVLTQHPNFTAQDHIDAAEIMEHLEGRSVHTVHYGELAGAHRRASRARKNPTSLKSVTRGLNETEAEFLTRAKRLAEGMGYAGVDFGDRPYRTAKFLTSNPKTGAGYRKRWPYSLDLTADEWKAVAFFRGRYDWADALRDADDVVERPDGRVMLHFSEASASAVADALRDESPSVAESFRHKLDSFASRIV